MRIYLSAHENKYDVSLAPSDRTEDGDYVRIQILYSGNADSEASSASVSVLTEELAAALRAFLPPNHPLNKL